MLRPAPHVRSATVDGLVVLLDLRTESYLVLDEVGSDMWEALRDAPDLAGALAALEERYDVDPGRLRSDLDGFVARGRDQGLLHPAAADGERDAARPARAPARAPTRMRAWRALLATSRDLSRHGLGTAYERVAATPLGEPAATPGLVADAVDAFLGAENLFLSRRAPDDCLLRSLALYRFLRSAGADAEHRIGVKRFPFGAHAWVEHDGEVLLGESGHASGFVPIASLPVERSRVPALSPVAEKG